MGDLELESSDEHSTFGDPSIFFSLQVNPDHEAAVGALLDKLIEFCDETGAGWIPTGPHRIPGQSSVVFNIYFTDEKQKQDFLCLPEYHELRISLVSHCQKDGISVLK